MSCVLVIEGTQLTTLGALKGLKTAEDEIIVRDNDKLADVSTLATVDFPTTNIHDNSSLEHIELDVTDGTASSFTLEGPVLTRVELMLSGESERDSIFVRNAPNLEELSIALEGELSYLGAFDLPELADLNGVEVGSVKVLELKRLAELTVAEVDAFVGALDVPPEATEICGLGDGEEC